jgi:hypothetical protein
LILQAESGVVIGISCSKADERDQLMEGLHDFAKALPQELSLHVLSFLDASDLISVSSVCRTWNLLANDDYVWKCLLQFQRELTISGAYFRYWIRLRDFWNIARPQK